MPLKDKQNSAKYMRQYRQEHRLKFQQYQQKYLRLHPTVRQEAVRMYRNSHKEQSLAATRAWRQKKTRETGVSYVGPKRKELVDLVLSWKKNCPCTDCGGIFPPECMDFDHVRGTKVMGVSEFTSRCASKDALIGEIKKCDLVCANCHRTRTKKRYYADHDEKPKGATNEA